MNFEERVKALREHHEQLLSRPNIKKEWGNGIYDKYEFPILTDDNQP